MAWLCNNARQVATGERRGGALAYLVIDAGHASAFALDGVHARAVRDNVRTSEPAEP